MSINKLVIDALAHYKKPVVPDIYEGDSSIYYTFNYDVLTKNFADNKPLFESALLSVHLFCPYGFNSVSMRLGTRVRLRKAGFSWPEEINATLSNRATGEEGQHYVFECRILRKCDLDEDD